MRTNTSDELKEKNGEKEHRKVTKIIKGEKGTME